MSEKLRTLGTGIDSEVKFTYPIRKLVPCHIGKAYNLTDEGEQEFFRIIGLEVGVYNHGYFFKKINEHIGKLCEYFSELTGEDVNGIFHYNNTKISLQVKSSENIEGDLSADLQEIRDGTKDLAEHNI